MGGCLSKDDRYVGGKNSYVMEQPYVIIPPSPLASAGYDKDDGVSLVEKAANNIVKKTKNRQRIDVDKSTNTQPITFNELLCESLLGKCDCFEHIHSSLLSSYVDAIKDCKNDEYKRVIVPSGLLWRAPEVEHRRLKDYEQDKDKWLSTADRLQCESFGYTAIKDKEGKLVAQIDETASKGKKMVWMENKYPYFFADGICHDVVFFGSIKGRDHCIHTIKNKLGPGREVVWFTNSIESRSVPEIDHIHIIYRDSPFLGKKTKYNTSIIESMKPMRRAAHRMNKPPPCSHRMNH